MSAPQTARRHHYVPQFYLRQWTGPDGMLWQYKRERSGRLSEQRKSPGGTGFREDLYLSRDVAKYMPERMPDAIETKFLAPLDDASAKVLQKFLSPDIPPLSVDDRTSWTLFLNSLLERGPRTLERQDQVAVTLGEKVLRDLLEECEDAQSREGLNRIFQKIDHAAMARNIVRAHMVHEIRRPEVIDHFQGLHWVVVTRAEGEAELITTDSPLVINCGEYARPIELMSLPISPDKLLVMFPEAWHKDFDDQFFHHLMLLHNILLIQGDGEYLYSRSRLENGPRVRLRFAAESAFGRPGRMRGE